MNHEGILSDQGILPERRHGGMIPTHRILSRLRRTLAVRVVAIVAALLLVSIPFATYARPGVMDEFAIIRKVSEVRIYTKHVQVYRSKTYPPFADL